MKYIKLLGIGAVILGFLYYVSPIKVSAIVVDSCNQEFTYSDFSVSGGTNTEVDDTRLFVQTINTGSTGNPDTITVTAKDGYEIVSISLEMDGFNSAGWDVVLNDGVTNYNPTGSAIEQFEVIVKKVCLDVCPNIEGTQETIPEGYILEEGQCVLPPPPVDLCPEEGVQTVLPCAEPPVVDVCANIEGNQETVPEGKVQDGENCVDPTHTPEPTPSPSPSPTPEPTHRTQGGGIV